MKVENKGGKSILYRGKINELLIVAPLPVNMPLNKRLVVARILNRVFRSGRVSQMKILCGCDGCAIIGKRADLLLTPIATLQWPFAALL